jgi:tetraacyldisaccharide 4'-kinase
MHIFENRVVVFLLWPFSLIFNLLIRLRNFAYDAGIFRTIRIDAKVISIGNISVGGTGKTPATIFLAEQLQSKGFHVAILSRGYGRRSKEPVLVSEGTGPLCGVADAGDEPYLMAIKTTGIPVLVDRDRVNGARLLMQKYAPDIILLDDGFQHRRLARDIDIVIIDLKQFVANHFLLPAGPLREPLRSLSRANMIYLVSGNNLTNEETKNVFSLLGEKTSAAFYSCSKEPICFWDPHKKMRLPITALKNKTIVAVAGIANPKSFVELLEATGAKIEHFQEYKDHYHYTKNDVDHILRKFEKSKAEYFVTTEKDWVKLEEFLLPLYKQIRILEIVFSTAPVSVEKIIEYLRF